MLTPRSSSSFFFFFNDTATTEIYPLSLHDALPISIASGGLAALQRLPQRLHHRRDAVRLVHDRLHTQLPDRKSTRLNSSHGYISYAVFCLKKKKKKQY